MENHVNITSFYIKSLMNDDEGGRGGEGPLGKGGGKEAPPFSAKSADPLQKTMPVFWAPCLARPRFSLKKNAGRAKYGAQNTGTISVPVAAPEAQKTDPELAPQT